MRTKRQSEPASASARLEVLSATGCQSCRRLYRRLQKRLEERLELSVTLEQVDILDDVDRAVALGVLNTPALVLGLIAQGADVDLDELFVKMCSDANR